MEKPRKLIEKRREIKGTSTFAQRGVVVTKSRNMAEEKILTHELAAIFGCSPRWINQLTTNGLLTQVERGRYQLGSAIREYIAAIKQQAEEKDEEETDLREEQTMLTRANRKMAELELAVMNGKLHRSEDVQNIMNEMLTSFRSRLLAIPARISPEVAVATDSMVVQQMINGEIYDALSELSEYDPAKFTTVGKEQEADMVVNPVEDTKPREKATKKARAAKNISRSVS